MSDQFSVLEVKDDDDTQQQGVGSQTLASPGTLPSIATALSSLASVGNVDLVLASQKLIGENLTASNKALYELNVQSEREYEAMREEFRRSTKMLSEMKKDLEFIFERIGKIRGALREKYGETVPQSSYTVEDDS